MKHLNFPIHFKFNIATFHNDFEATDASNNTIAYVKQKLFKLVDEINVYSDKNQSSLLYVIKANKWIDFSATYSFIKDGVEIGKIARKGWASIWKAHYEIFNNHLTTSDYVIREENAWAKVFDGLLGEIPILGIFTGYLFNPKYLVKQGDKNIIRLKKIPSFFGRRFEVEALSDVNDKDAERIVLALMMMILLERRRG
ncbi:MAG: hypothetical protein LCH32_04715 [Bacteroidetes bacterium]|nr:hypothetical protein [Bacteroidota bacterium]